MRRSWTHHASLLAACLALTVACGDDDDEPTPTDAGGVPEDAGAEPTDAGGTDAGGDAGEPVDAGGDAGEPVDGGGTDAGPSDAGSRDDAGGDAATVSTVELTADEFEFTPNEITVAPGTTLTVNLSNAGEMDHSIEFEIGSDEFELEADVAPGAEGALTFTVPDQPGEFEFYCPIGNHRDLGMTGTLNVEE